MSLSKRTQLFFLYVCITIGICIFLPKFFYIYNAKAFTQHYSNTIMICISIYGLLYIKQNIFQLLKHLLLLALSLSIISEIIFYILDETNLYFTFEMSGYSWRGLVGLMHPLIWSILGIVGGIIIWKVKMSILKYISKVS